jgi:hypothetical protein
VARYPGFWSVQTAKGEFRGVSLRDALAQYAQAMVYLSPSPRTHTEVVDDT